MNDFIRATIILLAVFMVCYSLAAKEKFDPMLANALHEYNIAITAFENDDIYRGCYHLNSAHRFARVATTGHGTAEAKINILKNKYNCKFAGDYQQ